MSCKLQQCFSITKNHYECHILPPVSSHSILILQFYHYKLRRVIDPERNNAVSHSPADNHRGVFLNELTCIILWEEPLVGSHQATYKRKYELSAMGMAAEYQIHASINIKIKQLRPVGQQDRKTVRLICNDVIACLDTLSASPKR